MADRAGKWARFAQPGRKQLTACLEASALDEQIVNALLLPAIDIQLVSAPFALAQALEDFAFLLGFEIDCGLVLDLEFQGLHLLLQLELPVRRLLQQQSGGPELASIDAAAKPVGQCFHGQLPLPACLFVLLPQAVVGGVQQAEAHALALLVTLPKAQQRTK